MGMMLEMKCPCGFSADITMGGTKRNHLNVFMFPHLCENCGVVNANIYSRTPSCPKCSSTEIIMYGEIEKAKELRIFGIRLRHFDRKYWYHDARVTRPDKGSHETWLNLKLSHGNHFCPACTRMRLRVSLNNIVFFD